MKINRLLRPSILILLTMLPIMAGRNSKHAPHRKHYRRSEQPDVIKKRNHHFQQQGIDLIDLGVPIAEGVVLIVFIAIVIGAKLFLPSASVQMSDNP